MYFLSKPQSYQKNLQNTGNIVSGKPVFTNHRRISS